MNSVQTRTNPAQNATQVSTAFTRKIKQRLYIQSATESVVPNQMPNFVRRARSLIMHNQRKGLMELTTSSGRQV